MKLDQDLQRLSDQNMRLIVGLRLRAERLRLRLSRDRFAARFGIPRTTLQRYESGERDMRLQTVLRLQAAGLRLLDLEALMCVAPIDSKTIIKALAGMPLDRAWTIISETRAEIHRQLGAAPVDPLLSIVRPPCAPNAE